MDFSDLGIPKEVYIISLNRWPRGDNVNILIEADDGFNNNTSI